MGTAGRKHNTPSTAAGATSGRWMGAPLRGTDRRGGDALSSRLRLFSNEQRTQCGQCFGSGITQSRHRCIAARLKLGVARSPRRRARAPAALQPGSRHCRMLGSSKSIASPASAATAMLASSQPSNSASRASIMSRPSAAKASCIDTMRLSAGYAGRILKGEKPEDLPGKRSALL